jgi:hypothetical protein
MQTTQPLTVSHVLRRRQVRLQGHMPGEGAADVATGTGLELPSFDARMASFDAALHAAAPAPYQPRSAGASAVTGSHPWALPGAPAVGTAQAAQQVGSGAGQLGSPRGCLGCAGDWLYRMA